MLLTPLDSFGECSDGTLLVRFRCAARIGVGKWCVPASKYSIERYAEVDCSWEPWSNSMMGPKPSD